MPNRTALTERDAAEIATLLGYLQGVLETVITCHTVPGTSDAVDSNDALIVRDAKAKWRRAEDMVKKLEAWRAA